MVSGSLWELHPDVLISSFVGVLGGCDGGNRNKYPVFCWFWLIFRVKLPVCFRKKAFALGNFTGFIVVAILDNYYFVKKRFDEQRFG